MKTNKHYNKIRILNSFVTLLLVVLISLIKQNKNIGDWLIYFSTWILIVHIGVGANYMIKYLKQKDNFFNSLLDFVLLICMFFGVLFFNRLVIWGILFAVFFTIAIIKYRIVYLCTRNERIKEYISKKVKNEITTIPLFTLLAILAYIFDDNLLIIRFLQGMVLLFQFFFVVWLVFVKKVYSMFKVTKPSN